MGTVQVIKVSRFVSKVSFCTLRFFFSPPSLSYPTVTFERCVKSFTIVTAEYFFSFQFLKSHTEPHNHSVPQISLSVAFSHSLN